MCFYPSILLNNIINLFSFFLFLICVHFDEGDKTKSFGYALVVGIDRAPKLVTRSMSARKIAKRSRVKPFIKLVNYNHIMPTRYTFEFAEVPSVKDKLSVELLRDATKKKEAKKEIRKALEEKYKTGQNKWFFQKLRF